MTRVCFEKMRLKTYKEVDVTMKAKNVLFYMAVGREKYKESVWFNHALSMAIIIHVCCGPLVCFSLFNRIVFYYRSSGVRDDRSNILYICLQVSFSCQLEYLCCFKS